MIAKETLYLTADRENVVKEGDPKAKFLIVKAGHEISDADAAKYEVKAGKPAPEPPAKSSVAPVIKNREEAMPAIRTRANADKKR